MSRKQIKINLRTFCFLINTNIFRYPKLKPICITKGALVLNIPSRDLRVSQQHRILVEGLIAMRMFGTSEVLVPAKALLSLPDIFIEEPTTSVSYHHVMLETHEIVVSEGLRSESLCHGPNALSSIPENVLQDALDVLGIDKKQLKESAVPSVRPFAQMKQARRLIARHRRNDVPLFEASKMQKAAQASKRDLPFFMS